MTEAELDSRLAEKPQMCQTWISAKTLGESGALYLSSIHDDGERIGTVHIYL